jgi:hypothetical protein
MKDGPAASRQRRIEVAGQKLDALQRGADGLATRMRDGHASLSWRGSDVSGSTPTFEELQWRVDTLPVNRQLDRSLVEQGNSPGRSTPRGPTHAIGD